MKGFKLLCVLLVGCADITAIEDGAVYGDVLVVQDWFTSIGLIENGETTMVIDAGYRPAKVMAALLERGVEPGAVDHVLLTHGHEDHVGALEIYPNAMVWALEDESDVLAEAGVSVFEPLSEGVNRFGDIEVEVFSMSGHTPGSAAFRIGSALLMGDTALFNRIGELTTVPERRSEDPEGAEAALAALATAVKNREDIDWVVPSHSGGGGVGALVALAE